MKSSYEFQNIYSDFHQKIHRYITRLIGASEADDVTQEVFLKVNASLGNFRGESSLSTWIYRIATNAATDYLRKSAAGHPEQIKDEPVHIDTISCKDDLEVEGDGPLPDTQLIRKEMNDCIRGVVEGLHENYRTVLILGDFEELSNSEIAEVLDISVDTVKIRLHRARARLKKELERHCSFYRDERNEIACDRKDLPVKFLKKS